MNVSWEKSIGEGLKLLRKQKALSQKELADELSISQSNLSKIEKGHVSLSASKLLWLLKRFNTPVEQFLPKTVRSSKINEDVILQNALSRLAPRSLSENSHFN